MDGEIQEKLHVCSFSFIWTLLYLGWMYKMQTRETKSIFATHSRYNTALHYGYWFQFLVVKADVLHNIFKIANISNITYLIVKSNDIGTDPAWQELLPLTGKVSI